MSDYLNANKILPYREYPIPPFDEQVVDEVCEYAANCVLEKAFCMTGRDEAKAAFHEITQNMAQSYAKEGNEAKAKEMLSMELDGKQLTDFMLSFIENPYADKAGEPVEGGDTETQVPVAAGVDVNGTE